MRVGAHGCASITIHLVVARVTAELTVPRACGWGNGARVHLYTAAGTSGVRVLGRESGLGASACR